MNILPLARFSFIFQQLIWLPDQVFWNLHQEAGNYPFYKFLILMSLPKILRRTLAFSISLAVFLFSQVPVATGKPTLAKTAKLFSTVPADTIYPRTYQIFTQTEQQPSFPGGDEELNNFIKKNLKYPKEALRKGVEGLVVVQFVVDRNGKISEPKVVKALGMGTDEEAIRVINLFPDFVPAFQNGKPVEFRYTLPIRYGLSRRRAKNN
ncbi:MAG: energy transducer TonB [Adhaeribacter sp.]